MEIILWIFGLFGLFSLIVVGALVFHLRGDRY